MNKPVLTEEVNGYTVEVHFDEDTYHLDPRQWDNVGIMACSHRRYRLGDEQLPKGFDGWSEVEAYLEREKGAIFMLPLYLYDHSIQSISTRSFIGRAHHASWDSGMVGLIYVTRERMKEMMGWTNLTEARRERLAEILEAEVEEYDCWMRGEAYYFEVKDPEGEVLDRMGGYLGKDADEYALAEGLAYAKPYARLPELI